MLDYSVSFFRPAYTTKAGPARAGEPDMSQTEGQTLFKESVEFFVTISDFLAKEPKTAVWLFHMVVRSLKETVRQKESLPYDIHYYLGAIDLLDDILWNRVSITAVANTIANPEIMRKFLTAVVSLAKVHNTIKEDNNTDMSDVIDRLDDARETLTDILKTVVEKAGDDDDS